MKSSKGIWRFFKIAVAAEVAVAVYPESPEHLGPQTLPNSTPLHSFFVNTGYGWCFYHTRPFLSNALWK
jgi:hypothetical protein